MAITLPDVTPEAVPGVRAQPTADETTFGGGPGLLQEGAEIQKIAQETGDIGAFERIRADQTAAEGARAKMSAMQLDTLYNPQTGILHSKGQDALKASQDGIDNLKKGFNGIVSGLSGEAQKGLASKMAIEMVDNANRTAMAHADTQMTAFHTEAMKSTVNNFSAAAAMGHGDAKVLADSYKHVNDATESYIDSERLDKQSADDLRAQNMDKFHSSVIDGLTKFQNDDSAQKYFTAHKDEITPATQEKLTDALETHNIRWRSANAAQDALNKNPDSMTGALADLDKIKNPEVQDAARRLVTARISEDRAAKKDDLDNKFMQMQTMLNQKGLIDAEDRRRAIPPLAWNSFTSEQQRALEKGGTPDVSSINTWEAFNQSVKDGSISKMSQADINTKFMPYLNATDQKTVADYWAGTKKSGGAKEKSYESVLQMQDQALVGIGALSPKNPTRNQLIYKKQFNDDVTRDLDTEESSVGRPLKNEEVQAVIDRHTLKAIAQQPEGLLSGHFGFVKYDQIPDTDKEHIVQLARSGGTTATKDHIETAYRLHKQGKSDDEIIKALR